MSRITIIAAAVIIGSATLAAAGLTLHKMGRDSGRADIQQQWDQYKDDQHTAAVELSTQLEKNKHDALKKSNVRKAAVAVDARAADSELYRLHSAVQSQSIAPKLGDTCTTERERIKTLSVVFEQCTSELVEMARHADTHLQDTLTLLDAWPRLVEPR